MKNAAPKWIHTNAYTRMNDKLKNKALLYPRSGAKNRVKAWAAENGTSAIASMAGESIEEVLQGFNDALAKTYTPALAGKDLITGLEEMYYPPEGFWDHHGGWSQLRDEAMGGFLGSAGTSMITAGKSITTLGDRAINRDILKKSKHRKVLDMRLKKELMIKIERYIM